MAAVALATAVAAAVAGPASVVFATHTYDNPLPMTGVPGGTAESCADPSVIKGQQAGDAYWYMYCTTDPLSSEDRNADDRLNFHLIPQFRSLDLVTWEYVGDAFASLPATAAPGAGLWAPEIDYDPTTNTYFLFYGVTDVADASSPNSTPGCPHDNGIAYATSSSPTGPWAEQGIVVAPRPNDRTPTCNFFWTYDPEVILTGASTGFIYYGSYYGGVHVAPLAVTAAPAAGGSATAAVTGPPTQVAIANRYEGAEVVTRAVGGTLYYYLFVSATDCCRGPLTGYSVFVGRATTPTGPFVDHLGRPLSPEPADGQVGGTPVLSMNGNGWVGPGHNTVFDDYAGRTWTVYHAIDSADPYFAGEFGFDKRPAMLDPIDWSADGWPDVRNGNWISDGPMPAPAAQPGHGPSAYAPVAPASDQPVTLLAPYSDEFDGPMDAGWSWIRQPAPAEYGIENGTFRFNVQKADLHEESNSAPVLVRDAPAGDYVVEARVRLDVPEGGCCPNYTQAGLVIYGGTSGTGGDDAFIKLVHFSLWETRQTEFAKEVPPPGPHPGGGPAGHPGEFTAEYGNTVVGPPDTWTFLRIVKRTIGGVEHYRAYTSRDADEDGVPDGWYRGGVWTHALGASRIGLVSMAEPGDREFVANFDYVRVYRLASEAAAPAPAPVTVQPRPPATPPRRPDAP